MIKIEYDNEADAAYLYLKHPINNREVKKTKELNKEIILDFDLKGNLLGLEILNASKCLTKEALEAKHKI